MAILQYVLYIQRSHNEKLCFMGRSVLAVNLPELSAWVAFKELHCACEVQAKISGLGKYKNFRLTLFQCRYFPFIIVPSELYTRRRVPLPLPEALQNLQVRDADQHRLRFSFNLRDAVCSSSLRCTLICGEIKMSQRARSWKWRGGKPPPCLFRLQIPEAVWTGEMSQCRWKAWAKYCSWRFVLTSFLKYLRTSSIVHRGSNRWFDEISPHFLHSDLTVRELNY